MHWNTYFLSATLNNRTEQTERAAEETCLVDEPPLKYYFIIHSVPLAHSPRVTFMAVVSIPGQANCEEQGIAKNRVRMVWRSLFIAQGRNYQGNSCYCSFRRFMTLLLLRTRQAATLKGQAVKRNRHFLRVTLQNTLRWKKGLRKPFAHCLCPKWFHGRNYEIIFFVKNDEGTFTMRNLWWTIVQRWWSVIIINTTFKTLLHLR